MKNNRLKDIPDEELEAEIALRRGVRNQKEWEARKEAERVYNLPENVAARKREADERVLSRCIQNGYNENQEGTWAVYGEDPNCDMGGYHHEPFLEYVEGKLSDVINYASTLPGFWQWGGGGKIELVGPRKVTILGKK